MYTENKSYLVQDEIQKTFKVSKNASNKEKFAKNILSGGFAGSLSLLFVQSIDYTRTRLGVDARNPAGQRQFTGIIDCYVKTVKADGVRGLYRGFWISCCCIFIYRWFSRKLNFSAIHHYVTCRGLYFGLYDTIKPMGKLEYSHSTVKLS